MKTKGIQVIRNNYLLSTFIFSSLLLTSYTEGIAQEKLKLIPLRNQVYFVKDSSLFEGNVVLLKEKSGGLLIDAQTSRDKSPLMDSLVKWNAFPIRWLVNTHWHPDHSNGNKEAKAKGIKIIAHENAYKRMQKGQTIEYFKYDIPPYPAEFLPDSMPKGDFFIKTESEEVRFHHPGPAHTDGDLIVHFTKANVIHAGDLVLNHIYPFLELSSGANLDGLTASFDWMISKSDDKTIIIPGHGDAINKRDLVAYRAMYKDVSDEVKKAVKQNKSLQEIQNMKLTGKYDAHYDSPLIPGNKFIEILYQSITGKKA